MADWYEVPDQDGSFSVAGYREIGGTWQDVESAGGTPLEDTAYGPADVDQVTFHYMDEDTGDDVYFTMYGPWEDWGDFAEAIGDMLDRYGVGDG